MHLAVAVQTSWPNGQMIDDSSISLGHTSSLSICTIILFHLLSIAISFALSFITIMASSSSVLSDLSTDEVSRLSSAMNDPTFRSLLADYAAEISSPQYKQENELIIKQLEEEVNKTTSASSTKQSSASPSSATSSAIDGFYATFRAAMQQQQQQHKKQPAATKSKQKIITTEQRNSEHDID